MKKTVRLIAATLSLVMLLLSMTSCLSIVKLIESSTTEATTVPTLGTTAPFGTTPSGDASHSTESTAGTGSGTASSESTGNGGSDTPAQSLLEKYPYTLTEEEFKQYQEQLELCESLALQGTDPEAIEAAWDTLFELYDYITTQSRISYVRYCTDLSDTVFSEEYLFATAAATDAFSEYIEVCQNIYQSDSPYKTEFFEGWTEDEIESMLSVSPELAECDKINDEILVEYRSLGDGEFTDKTCELFMKMVENNNRIAELNGYENYIEYAYSEIYLRDYQPEKIEEMRALVKEYLIPMFKQVYYDLVQLYQTMSNAKYQRVETILEGAYEDLDLSALERYFSSLSPDSGASMKSMFENGNMIFTDSNTARAGAFTGYLYQYETPICYFGPGYQSIFTVTHELGHYYAFVQNGSASLQMDFAELQSQGNEFLFLAFMENENPNGTIWKAVAGNQLYSTLISIIVCCMVDEFEQYVYTHEITDPTTELDQIMQSISATYGNGFFDNFVDLQSYWRYVVIESPVYYISYAVSGIMALDLYRDAKFDYTSATEQYRALVEEVTEDATLQDFLTISGLGSPFDEETYKRIAQTVSAN